MMKQQTIALCLALGTSIPCAAQPQQHARVIAPWVVTLGGPEAEVINASDAQHGAIVVAGFTAVNGAANLDGLVASFGEDGQLNWQASIGMSGTDELLDVRAMDDGGCIAIGYTTSLTTGSVDAWAVRLDGQGQLVWQFAYGGPDAEAFTSIAPSPRGSYIGGVQHWQGQQDDVWLLEIDDAGAVLWQQTFIADGVDGVMSVAATDDGLITTINSNSSFDKRSSGDVPFYRPWIIRLDQNGVVQWSKTYNVSGGDSFNAIRQTRDGGFVAAGEVLAHAFFRGDLWIVRLDGSGDLLWDQRMGDNFGVFWVDAAWAVEETSDGGFLAAGQTGTAGLGSEDVWLVKVDQNGVYQWDRTYGTPNFDNGRTMTLVGDANIFLAGSLQPEVPEPFDGLAMLLRPDGSLGSKCNASTAGQPNIWTDAIMVDAVEVTAVPTSVTPFATSATLGTMPAPVIFCPPSSASPQNVIRR